MSNPLLKIDSVEKLYPGECPVHAVNRVSLTLQQGDFAAVVGTSGSGKTTLLNLSSGLDRPTRGKIWILGQEITAMASTELALFRRNHLGFVFQSYNLFSTLTVIENIEYTRIIRGDPPKPSREIAMQALKQVGLEDKANRFPSQLSGGQQQRIAVARALATEAKLIFADEPTANLDSNTALQLIELFEKLNQDLHVTFLFSTHDHQLVKKVGIRFEMKDGKIQ